MRVLLLLVVLVIFAGRIVLTYTVFNDTVDEAGHIVAGLEIFQRGTYTIENQHPPLSRLVLGVLPYYFAGLRLNDRNDLWLHGAWFHCDALTYWKSLALARAGNLLFAAILFFFAFLCIDGVRCCMAAGLESWRACSRFALRT